MSEPSTILALTIITIILGSWALWLYHERTKRLEAEAELEWQQLFEANRYGDHLDHTPIDVLTERPLLPDDYRDWRK